MLTAAWEDYMLLKLENAELKERIEELETWLGDLGYYGPSSIKFTSQ